VEGVQNNSIEVKGTVTLGAPTNTGVIMEVGGTYVVNWTTFRRNQ